MEDMIDQEKFDISENMVKQDQLKPEEQPKKRGRQKGYKRTAEEIAKQKATRLKNQAMALSVTRD